MLCWICPECGRDCSPAVRECPACAQGQSGVTQGVLSMVESLRAVPSVPLLAQAPQQYLLFGLTNGHSSESSQAAVLTGEQHAVPAPNPNFKELKVPDEPPVSKVVVAPLIESQNPAVAQPPAPTPPEMAKPNPFLARVAQIAELRIPARYPVAPALPVQSTSLPAAEPPAIAETAKPDPVTLPVPGVKFIELAIRPNPPARTAPCIEAVKLEAAPPPDRTVPCVAQPEPFRAGTVRIIGYRPSARGYQPSALGYRPSARPSPKVAPLAPSGGLPAQPMAAYALRIIASGSFASTNPQFPDLVAAAEPFCLAAGFVQQAGILFQALELQAEAVLDQIQSGLDAEETKIRAIVATFQTLPKLALLCAPSAIVAAPAPPDLQWLKMPRPTLPARKPSDRKCDTLTAPPQKLPLAGPCLPPELENYIEAPPARSAGARKAIGLPAWIVSLVIASSLFLAIAVAMQYLSTSPQAKAAVVPAPSAAVASAPAAPAFEQHPFARFVEVTGLRVVADLNHRSQVQYIVVNHSATQLSGMTIKIAVRSSAEPAGSSPLFTVSAVVPSLGPHQSKEIRTDLDSQLRSSAIPDWEYLRTEVQVGTQN